MNRIKEEKEVTMKILVCTDGSEHSMKAVKKAKEIAEIHRAEVAIIHVYPIDLSISSGSIHYTPHIEYYEAVRKVKNEAGNKILQEAAEVFAGSDIKVNTILEEGHPARTIIEKATAGGYDLIVLGSRGIGGIKKFILGSVSNAVTQEAKTNVLLVK